MQNIIQAIRLLRKTPGLSLLVALILAAGIGANTSVFTLVNAALLRPLPYRDASRLLYVAAIDRSGSTTSSCLSYPHFQLLREHSRSFSSMAAFTNETFSFSTRGEPIEYQAARVSWNFFDVLGVSPAAGRSFTADEGSPGGKAVALISNKLWRQRFHADPNVVGTSIALDRRSYTIIGVLPASFQFGLLGNDIPLWTPRIDELNLASAQQIQGGTCYLDSVARLAPGVSIEQARAEMKILDQRYVREFSKMGDADPKRPVDVVPLKTKLVANFRSVLVMLAAAVVLVVSIACANAAGLLLTRALKRRREVAVRIAMGATRSQLIMQFLTESVLLALLGGIVGVAISVAAIHLAVPIAGQSLPLITELPLGLDLNVLTFALTLSVVTGVLFGLAVAAGLLLRSFIALEKQPCGFNAHNVLTMNIALPPSNYAKPEQMSGFFDQLLQRVEILPGVKAAAVSSALPVNVARLTPILVEGQPEVPLPERPIIIVQAFTSSYLRVLRVPLKKGRFFDVFDTRDSSPVMVVNESFARKFFPSQDPIGKHVWIGRRTVPAQIVGMIGDIKNVSLSVDPQPEFDLPFAQLPWAKMNLMLRTDRDPKLLTDAVRRQIANLDSDLPVTEVQSLDEVLANASSRPRLLMLLLGGFAGFAFVLALVGLYGALSYSVAQRTQEMGVRVALGATKRDVLRLVLGYGASVTGAGIAIGVGCSLLLTNAMQKLVYGVSTRDPITFCLAPLTFLSCALLASYVPARRAMRVDVVDALRQ